MMADSKKSYSNPIGPALAGMAIGAAAVILSDEKTRKKVKSKFEELRSEGAKKLEEAQDTIEKGKKQAKRRLNGVREKVEEEVDDLKA